MNWLKRWLRRLWCGLTGGCTYSDANIHSYHDEFNETYRFRNRCLKCGKMVKWEVPVASILPPVSMFYVHVEEDENGLEN